MNILTKTKWVILSAFVLFAAVFSLSPAVEATTSVPDGLYSVQVMSTNDPMDNSKTIPVYMQIRIDGANVVLGAGQYSIGPSGSGTQFQSCLRTTYTVPDPLNPDSFFAYSGTFDINEMYNMFKRSVILDSSGNTVTGTFPDVITEISHGAFENWTSLTTVIVPSSVEVIGSNAFFGSSVTTVDLSQATNLTDINSSTFQGCTNLQSIDLSNTNITTLHSQNFDGCTTLSSVKLPDTLTTIDYLAFNNTSSLTQLTIPPNVTEIDEKAFEDPSVSPKTKTIKFARNFNSSFYDMAINNKTYVKLLFPAGNPTWENSASVQALIASGNAASYITTPPVDVFDPPERTNNVSGTYSAFSEEEQEVNSGIEDTPQTEAPTSSSEAIDTVQEQDEGQSGNLMVIVIAILIIACIGGALIFFRVKKNK